MLPLAKRACVALVVAALSMTGCAALVPPAAAEPPADKARAPTKATANTTRSQADPEGPVAACDQKGRPISEWPDALLPAPAATTS